MAGGTGSLPSTIENLQALKSVASQTPIGQAPALGLGAMMTQGGPAVNQQLPAMNQAGMPAMAADQYIGAPGTGTWMQQLQQNMGSMSGQQKAGLYRALLAQHPQSQQVPMPLRLNGMPSMQNQGPASFASNPLYRGIQLTQYPTTTQTIFGKQNGLI